MRCALLLLLLHRPCQVLAVATAGLACAVAAEAAREQSTAASHDVLQAPAALEQSPGFKVWGVWRLQCGQLICDVPTHVVAMPAHCCSCLLRTETGPAFTAAGAWLAP